MILAASNAKDETVQFSSSAWALFHLPSENLQRWPARSVDAASAAHTDTGALLLCASSTPLACRLCKLAGLLGADAGVDPKEEEKEEVDRLETEDEDGEVNADCPSQRESDG